MRVNHGLTPQDLKAYGINDVQDIVHNPSYDMLFPGKSSTRTWKATNVAY